jgi:ribosome-associated translation inhibitor RaiA
MIDVTLANAQGTVSGGRAQARLTRVLESHGITTARATLAFTDENGPKGGVATRCAIGLRLARRPELRAEHVATTGRLALDGALDVLERELTQLVERRRESARHPKKYYAARRLLGGRRKTSTRND